MVIRMTVLVPFRYYKQDNGSLMKKALRPVYRSKLNITSVPVSKQLTSVFKQRIYRIFPLSDAFLNRQKFEPTLKIPSHQVLPIVPL